VNKEEEKEAVLGFLSWAATKGIHLATHGRPPFGTSGTYFMSRMEVLDVLGRWNADRRLSDRQEDPDGVQ